MNETAPRNEEEPAPAAPVDEVAEPMRLRGEAPRVTRLSRKALTAIGLVASVGLGGALISALQNHNTGKPEQELYSTDSRTTADGLAGLPHDYSGVPQLGPPLPGDLGRPILNAQNRGQAVPTPTMPAPNPGPSAEDQRRLQEIDAARTSKLFSGAEAARMETAGTGSAPNPQPNPTLANLGLAPTPATPTAQDRQNAFLTAEADRKTVAPDRVQAPISPNILQAGAVIPAALLARFIHQGLAGDVF